MRENCANLDSLLEGPNYGKKKCEEDIRLRNKIYKKQYKLVSVEKEKVMVLRAAHPGRA